ncbi:MAG: hypothetical protein ACKO5J_16550 [Rubrivivax sp.]
MKNITLSADAALIEAARARAREQHSTLNEQFRLWLSDYAHPQERLQRYDAVMKQLRGKLQVGRKLTRDEMNAR